MCKRILVSVCLPVALLLCVSRASADPTLRMQVDQTGDFVLLGNTLGHECDLGGTPAMPAPVVGTVGTCPDANSTAPDVFWRSDDPQAGAARAASNISVAQARSTALLALPSGAEVSYARLYWAAMASGAGPDTTVRVERPASGLDTMVTSDASFRVDENMNGSLFWYQSTADVTAIVQAEGPGAFRVSDVNSLNLVNLGDNHPFVAWYLVVFYTKDGDPSRNLALFDGLDLVQTGAPKSVTLSGFLVPNAGFDAKLGVVAFEGEAPQQGDALSFDGSTLSNALNPANNFFNATRSRLGAAVSNVGDLPQLTGTPRSQSGMDMDVIDVKALLMAGQTSAAISATTSSDTYLIGAFITSISTLKPLFESSQKKLTDLNGGSIRAGDELEYEVTITNTGSDVAVNTVLTDTLPAGVSYVTGSTQVGSGANAGKKTDAKDGDQAEFSAGTHKLIVRVGTGANDKVGGSLQIDESTVVSFRVTVNADASGTISNQAVINAEGAQGAPAENTLTDGNGVEPGAPPTDVTIDGCALDTDCKAPTPLCDISTAPQSCVACITSDDCDDTKLPDCSTTTHVCECTAGAGKCGDVDADGDGLSDAAEDALGTDPNDADSDDDGVSDGGEFAPDQDSDGDGLTNALDSDSDNDGLFDGTELGFDCSGPDLDLARGSCRPDADAGATTTNPVKEDTDGGGATDGSEDTNLDGAVDAGERNPTLGHEADDGATADSDQDGDGVSDALEEFWHSNPKDKDSDDDGLLDGQEANPSEDTDSDGLVNILDVDSDNDGLYDGTELGKGCADTATDAAQMHCRADSDAGVTQTSPLLRDTDEGGASDGSEDVNHNGIVDGTETDPTLGHGADDNKVTDTDGDGLGDALEDALGTDKNDADSDDDGLSDGEEPNPQDDHDGDGKINALDPDSDNDGLFDGTELGKACSAAGTDASKKTCVADADAGASKTSPVNDDTDFGGKKDGVEDTNLDGKVDPGELDPNNPQDDQVGQACMSDPDCGGMLSGVVCEAKVCSLGCRGSGGNSCPGAQTCSSTSNVAGQCHAAPGIDGGIAGSGSAGASGTGAAGASAAVNPGARLGGGGCSCGVTPLGTSEADYSVWLLVPGLAWLGRRRAARRRTR